MSETIQENQRYKHYDTVRLRSGGPIMIVLRRHGDLYLCGWHTMDGAPTTDLFMVHELDPSA